MRRKLSWAALVISVGLLMTSVVNAELPALGRYLQGSQNLGTSFAYQGHLAFTNSPVTDTCDMRFDLFDNMSGGNQIGETNLVPTFVEDGAFSAQLDFGEGSFDGGGRFIEIGVGCPAGNEIVTLSPRQPISPSPYAIYSGTAGRVNWGGVEQVPAGFADGVDADTLGGLNCELGQTPLFGDGGWACFDAGSTVTTVHNNTVRASSYTSMATTDSPVLTYLSGEELRVAKCDNRRCSSASGSILIDNAKDPFSVAASSDGTALVAYKHSTGSVKLARCSDPTCSGGGGSTTIDNLSISDGPSLAISGEGVPVIAYVRASAGLMLAACDNASCSSITRTELNSASGITSPSVAVSATGAPVVAYVLQSGGTRTIHLATSNQRVLDVLFGAVAVHVTIGGDSLPLVAALHEADTEVGWETYLHMYHCEDILCSEVVSSSHLIGSNSIALQYSFDLKTGSDGLGVLVVPIRRSVESGMIAGIAKCEDAACISLVTSPTGIDYARVSMTVGLDGAPVVGYSTIDRTVSIVHCASSYSCSGQD